MDTTVDGSSSPAGREPGSQPEAQPVRVMLVDDHGMMRAGLRMLIESTTDMVVVGEAASPEAALVLTQRESPDIILLDLILGAVNSLEVLPKLLEAAPKARVIVLTGVTDATMHRRAITSGAVGIVLKEQASEVLLKAIARVHEGEVWVDRSMMSEVLAAFTSGRGNADPEQEKIDSLTEREREVIDLIAKGMKNQQIADALFISESTVRRHLNSIFTKLDVTDRLELLVYTLQHGVIAPPSRG